MKEKKCDNGFPKDECACDMAKNWQSDWEKELLELLEKEQYTTICPPGAPRHKHLIAFIRNLIQKEREEATEAILSEYDGGVAEGIEIGRQDAFKEVLDVIKKAQRFVPEIAVDIIQEEITKLSENK